MTALENIPIEFKWSEVLPTRPEPIYTPAKDVLSRPLAVGHHRRTNGAIPFDSGVGKLDVSCTTFGDFRILRYERVVNEKDANIGLDVSVKRSTDADFE